MTKAISVNLSNKLEILKAIAVLTDERNDYIAKLENIEYDDDYKIARHAIEKLKGICETEIALFDEILRLKEIIKHLRGGSLEKI